MTAPVASGWSGLPGGIHTHWKAPPFHGAREVRTLEYDLPALLEVEQVRRLGERSNRSRRGADTIASTAPRSAPTSRQRAEKGDSSTSSWPLAGRVHQ